MSDGVGEAMAFREFRPSPARNWDEQRVYGRAVEAVIWGMPAVSMAFFRQGAFEAYGIGYHDVLAFSHAALPRHELLTSNAQVPYVFAFFDLRQGPVVMEVPRPMTGRCCTGRWSMPGRSALPTSARPARTGAGAGAGVESICSSLRAGTSPCATAPANFSRAAKPTGCGYRPTCPSTTSGPWSPTTWTASPTPSVIRLNIRSVAGQDASAPRVRPRDPSVDDVSGRGPGPPRPSPVVGSPRSPGSLLPITLPSGSPNWSVRSTVL